MSLLVLILLQRKNLQTIVLYSQDLAPTAHPSSGVCPSGMVLIQAGSFIMGSADGRDNEKPLHEVRLSEFCIHKTEVTVAAYQRCMNEKDEALRCTAPRTRMNCNWGDSKENHPINCVNWNQASKYCSWEGGSLPTEAQWEYAARGRGKNSYPWGDEAPYDQLCWVRAGSSVEGTRLPGTCEVGSYPSGDTELGLRDMAGNVAEWVKDGYRQYPSTAEVDPIGPENAQRVLRGGEWKNFEPSYVRTTARATEDASTAHSGAGFRCVRPRATASAPSSR